MQWILQVFFFRKTNRIGGDMRYNAGKVEKRDELQEKGKRNLGRKRKGETCGEYKWEERQTYG